MSCERYKDYGLKRPALAAATHPFGTDPVSKLIPILRHSFSSLIANELIAVQPMSLPSGLLFYMDYRYESKEDYRVGNLFGNPPGMADSFLIRDAGPIIQVDYSRFPHLCPRCRAPAYIGLMNVECSNERCR